MAWCSPAVHLNGVSRSRAASIQPASVSGVGNRSASSPPVRNFRRCSPSATTSAAASQDAVASVCGSSTYTGVSSSSAPVAPRGVHRGRHPAGVARQVVGVAQRDLQAGDGQVVLGRELERAGDRARPTGHHDGDRDGLGHRRQRDVGDHERGDQVGVPLVAPADVRRQRLRQRGVAGREDGGVVDEASEGFRQHPLTLVRSRRSRPATVRRTRRPARPARGASRARRSGRR